MRTTGALAAVVALAVASTLAASAGAAPARGLSDGRLLASAEPQLRAAGAQVATRIGARYGRIPIAWSTALRMRGNARPAEHAVGLADPAHPAYDWSRIDAALRDLRAASLAPIAYLMSAPHWAQASPVYAFATESTWAPRPADLAAFASAVARRYDGRYPDPLNAGATLPRIAHFQTWNEPNLARYLQPQWVGDARARPQLFSARWYRGMHVAAYAAIRARQPTAKIALAALAPTGAPLDGDARVSPLRFLRALLCLDAPRRCGPALPFDAIAVHPLSVRDPDEPAVHADDLAVADLEPKLGALLRRARRSGAVRGGTPELWVTELNWTASPAAGIAEREQPALIGRAMARLAQAGATIVNWQFATDPPIALTQGVDRPAGLTAPSTRDARLPGKAKPFLAGFAFPVTAVPLSRAQAWVWSMPPRGSGRVRVEARRAGRWQTVAVLKVRDGIARGRVAVPAGVALRVRAGRTLSAVIRVRTRLRLAAAGTGDRAAVGRRPASDERGAVRIGAGGDAQVADAGGPGYVPPVPPVLRHGAPPTATGEPVRPRPRPRRPRKALVFLGTPGDDLTLGTAGADLLLGRGGHDRLIGFGGRDRTRR